MTIRRLPWQIRNDINSRDALDSSVAAVEALDHLQLAMRLHHSLDPQAILGAFFDELRPRLSLYQLPLR